VLLSYKYKKSSTIPMTCMVFLRGFNANIGKFSSTLLKKRIQTSTMKHSWAIVILALILSCSSDTSNRNPYLQEVRFRFEINLNLPLYNELKFTGNPVHVDNNGVGTRGAFVINTGSGFMAWEASCPNHAPNDCSTMEIDGQNAVCNCEGYTYNLFTGQQLDRPDDGNRYHDLLFYRATQSGNSVIISN
jgi:nitrite reductase/ring-hydroxylating ferredoxin subunit